MPQKWGHTWFEIVGVVFHLLFLNHRHNIVQINGEVADGLKAGFQPLLYLYKYLFK